MTLNLFTLLKNYLYASVLSPPVIGFNRGHLRGSLVSFWQITQRFQFNSILKQLSSSFPQNIVQFFIIQLFKYPLSNT